MRINKFIFGFEESINMKLKAVLNGIEGLKAKGDLEIDIKSIAHDSRKVEKDGMFIAIKGYETDGHKFIKNAIEKGAKVIVVEEGASIKKSDIVGDVTIVMAPNTRSALAKIACNFYNNPSAKFNLIGITGTKGKTTTTFMIKSILEKHGQKVGLIGTVANYIGDKNLGESQRTTPESLELQELLEQLFDNDQLLEAKCSLAYNWATSETKVLDGIVDKIKTYF